MLARGRGHIVVTSSLAAWRGLPGAAAYSVAKAALTAMMESLRIDLGPHGIDVTVLSPGFVQTKPEKKEASPFRSASSRPPPAWRVRSRRAGNPMPFRCLSCSGSGSAACCRHPFTIASWPAAGAPGEVYVYSRR